MAVNLSFRSESPTHDESPRASPSPAMHDTSGGSISDDTPCQSTPNRRKNKRKMSEPRRLSDYGEKRARGSEGEDSGVETTSAGSADKSPDPDAAKLPVYPPTIMVPTYLPAYYPYMTPALAGIPMQMLNNAHTSQLPQPGENGKKGLAPGEKVEEYQEQDGEDGLPRQYKTMTVERRVEANARERTRVHTISAAFEALRRAVPAYSYNQKLSKLAILRIACCYILSLSRLADKDYSRDQSRPSFGECVDLTTRTIQAEGRAKKRH